MSEFLMRKLFISHYWKTEWKRIMLIVWMLIDFFSSTNNELVGSLELGGDYYCLWYFASRNCSVWFKINKGLTSKHTLTFLPVSAAPMKFFPSNNWIGMFTNREFRERTNSNENNFRPVEAGGGWVGDVCNTTHEVSVSQLWDQSRVESCHEPRGKFLEL